MGTGIYGGFGNTVGASKNKQGQKTTVIKNGIVFNTKAMKESYPLTKDGYFGERGKNCRIIKSPDPVATSKDFYSKISTGGKESTLENKHGVMSVLPDNTRIVYRVITSTKGSPAVEITVSSPSPVKKQKIHFELEG